MSHVTTMTLEHEPGVAYYAFAKSVDEPDTFVVIEVYRDVKDQALHMATDWVRNSLPQSMLLVDGKPDIKQYATSGSIPVTHRLFGVE